MDEEFNPDELSPKHQELLRAFDEMDLSAWKQVSDDPSATTASPLTDQLAGADESRPEEDEMLSTEDMLIIFVGEADEDLTTLKQILQQLEPFTDVDDQLDNALLQALQYTAHKIKGTSAAVKCFSLSLIARHLENLAGFISQHIIESLLGLNALVQTIHALELTLDSVVASGYEDSTYLEHLEQEYQALDIYRPLQAQAQAAMGAYSADSLTEAGTRTPLPHLQLLPGEAMMHVDLHRIEHLALHTERLAELNTPLESAQGDVEKAFQELQTAQARLHHLETLLSSHEVSLSPKLNGKAGQGHEYRHQGAALALLSGAPTPLTRLAFAQERRNEEPSSLLVARILHESEERTGHSYQRKTPLYPAQADETVLWDDLEIDRFTERDILMHSLSEAIADVATASTHLGSAFTRLNQVMEQYKQQATHVRDDTLLLSLLPVSTLLPAIEQVIQRSAALHQRIIRFEVRGETTEIDQQVLEALSAPLLQLIAGADLSRRGDHPPTWVDNGADTLSGGEVISRPPDERIWLYTQSIGSEVSLEIGFSMPIAGGALDEIQAAIQRVKGTVSAGRNAAGGISFYLSLPRSHRATQALLLRIGAQRVATPILHVQRIIEENWLIQHGLQESICSLQTFLGFSGFSPTETEDTLSQPSSEGTSFGPTHRPVLFLSTPRSPSQLSGRPLVIQVDEVIGTVELIVKPLAPHLQRPGIIGTAIDGSGNVVLMLDLPELARSYWRREQVSISQDTHPDASPSHLSEVSTKAAPQGPRSAHPLVLIADDSVYMRKSLRQTLHKEGYRVIDAHDGVRALEMLSAGPLPHALLLDVEMPNLNGYDLLSIMRLHPEFADIRIIMLTSRSSGKHQARALELGVYGYLTKPCPEELLIETVRTALGQ